MVIVLEVSIIRPNVYSERCAMDILTLFTDGSVRGSRACVLVPQTISVNLAITRGRNMRHTKARVPLGPGAACMVEITVRFATFFSAVLEFKL